MALALSVTISGLGRLFGGELHALVETAHVADDLGIDQLMVPDHLAMGRRTDRYPYGRFPLPARGALARAAHDARGDGERDAPRAAREPAC